MIHRLRNALLLILVAAMLLTGCGNVLLTSGQATPTPTSRTTMTPPPDAPDDDDDDDNESPLILAGRIEVLDETFWVIDGVRVQIDRTTRITVQPVIGQVVQVQAVLRQQNGAGIPVAVQVQPLRELEVVGTVTALDDLRLVVDDRVIWLSPETVLDRRVQIGSIVRLIARHDDDDDDRERRSMRLVAATVAPLLDALVVEGPLERIDDGYLVIAGRRLTLGRGVWFPRTTLVIGLPLRVIILPVSVQTIIAVTVIQVNINVVLPTQSSITTTVIVPPPPPATMQPIPPPPPAPTSVPPPVVVQPRPQPPVRPAPPERPRDDRDKDRRDRDRDNDDDDDDDDD